MKKKFFTLGLALLATTALASCGNETATSTKAAETTTKVAETTTATATETTGATETTTGAAETTTAAPTETTTSNPDDGEDEEEEETFEFHEGVEPTYSQRGIKPYYEGSLGGIYDEDLNEVEFEQLYIDYLPLEGEVTEFDSEGNAVTNISVDVFRKAYGYEYLLDVTFGDQTKTIPYVKWIEELANGDVAITADGNVKFTAGTAAEVEAFGLAVGTKFSVKLNDSELYNSKIAALNHLYEAGPVMCDGRTLTLDYVSGTKETYLANGYQLLDNLKNPGCELSNEEIVAAYEAFTADYYFIADQYRICQVLSDRNNEYGTLTEIMALVYRFGELDQAIDIAAYESKYKNAYYGQWDEYKDEFGVVDETLVKEYVDSLNPETTGILNSYKLAMEDALNEYSSNEISVEEALYTYYTNAAIYADYAGYDNYLEYAYENDFGREYTVAQTDQLKDYITDYIVPSLYASISVYSAYRSAAYADHNVNPDSELFYEYYFDLWGLMEDYYYGNYFEYLADYCENVVGDEMAVNFKNYFLSGNYWYSNIPNNSVTGYVWTFTDGTPFMFLSGSTPYQAVTTFIHEFGHLNEAIVAASSSFYSMDLNEVHSQGNEMLFYKYLTTTDVLSQDALDAFMSYRLYRMLNTVIEGYLVNELEKWIFTQDMTQYTVETFNEALLNQWAVICEEVGVTDLFGGSGEWYKTYVLPNYQGYYISYSLSAVASLEIYAQSCEDYELAVENYKKLYQPHAYDTTFTDVLIDSGFLSVFDEEAYIKIAAACGVVYGSEE